MKKLISAALLLAGALFGSGTANADALCTGKFPNLISDVCWSCMMPIKLFGTATLLGAARTTSILAP
ncbi:TraU family protein [Cupriavidus sp. EM10]|uniref:TraU family protein n=1 Tax=Cupriavidus sp. EM10 TaxID=2839983 RepID=UPI001CED7392|nr:TraU family protein [Cupriavidus sp. EM10]